MATFGQILSEMDIQRNMEFYHPLKKLWEAMTGNEARRGEDPLVMATFVRDNMDELIARLSAPAYVQEEDGYLYQKTSELDLPE